MRWAMILSTLLVVACNTEPEIIEQTQVNGGGNNESTDQNAETPVFADFNNIAVEYCSCHSSDSNFAYKIDDEQSAIDDKGNIISRIDDGSMPPSSEEKQLSEDQKALMLSYLNSL